MMKHVRILRVIGPVLLVLLAAGCAHWFRAAPIVARNTLVVTFMDAVVVTRAGSEVHWGTHGLYLGSGAVFVASVDSGQSAARRRYSRDGLYGFASHRAGNPAREADHYKVKTTHVVVGDVGTEFLVVANEDSTLVAVLSGEVGALHEDGILFLGAGEQASFDAEGVSSQDSISEATTDEIQELQQAASEVLRTLRRAPAQRTKASFTPPSTGSMAPVVREARSEARKRTASATSSARTSTRSRLRAR